MAAQPRAAKTNPLAVQTSHILRSALLVVKLAGLEESEASAAVVMQVGYNAAFRPALGAGDWVVVYGDGLIGQFGAQAARARGARVILVGHRPERLRSLGPVGRAAGR